MQNHTLHMQRPCPRRAQTRNTTYFQTNLAVADPCFQRPKSDENLIFRACQGPRPMRIIPRNTAYFQTNSAVLLCFQRPKSIENLIFRACQGPRPMRIIPKTHRNPILNENGRKPRDFFDKGFFYRVFFWC